MRLIKCFCSVVRLRPSIISVIVMETKDVTLLYNLFRPGSNRQIVATTVAHLLVAATKGPKAIQEEFDYSLKRLWRFRQRRRPGRKFE